MRDLRARLTYANVMSSIAVFMVLGGSAYAATTLPKSSVGSKQIKSNAVTSVKVKDGSLLAKDFRTRQLATGPSGPKGADGQPGPKGADGTPGTNGARGTDGSNGTARAYAEVTPAGGVIAAQSHNVTSVTRIAAGDYCVNLAASVPATSTGAVASPDFTSDSTASNAITHVEYSANCGANGEQILTYRVTSTASGLSAVATDEPFFVMIP